MSITKEELNKVIAISRSYGATRLILFGSGSKSLQSARDLDLACEGVLGWKLFDLGARLEDELGIPIDIIPLQPSSRFTRYIESTGRDLL